MSQLHLGRFRLSKVFNVYTWSYLNFHSAKENRTDGSQAWLTISKVMEA